MNLPKGVLHITCHVINNTPKIVIEKIGTHSLQGFLLQNVLPQHTCTVTTFCINGLVNYISLVAPVRATVKSLQESLTPY